MSPRLSWLLTAIVATQAVACRSGVPPTTIDLLIRNVTVVSPERAQPLTDVDVAIDKGRILSISPHSARLGSAARQEIDGERRYLVPGLIDGHVHLYHATGLQRRYTKNYDDLSAVYQVQQPRSFLYYGYTTVIELNARFEAHQRFESAPLRPDLYHCGKGVVLSNDFMRLDYPDDEAFFAEYPAFLHDRFSTTDIPAGYAASDHTPAAVVAAIAKQGGRCVKIYYEEALWWPASTRPTFALPSEAIIREVVAEAHAHRMPVLLHGTTPAAYRFAAATGVDIIAHGMWEWEGASTGRVDVPPEAFAAVDAIANGKLSVQPTVRTTMNTAVMFERDWLEQSALHKVLPPSFIEYLRHDAQPARQEFDRRIGPPAAAARARGEVTEGTPAAVVRTYLAHQQTMLREMQARGVSFLFGTDTAVGGAGWGNPPGLNGYLEMQHWVQAGVPLATVFRAATIDNATAFHLDDELGTIEIGKRANALLLTANPLEKLEAWDSIDKVILDGQPVARDALAADTDGRLGMESLTVPADTRPSIPVQVWYGTDSGAVETRGGSRIRPGYEVVPGGRAATSEPAPLVVLMHGSGGSADSMAWIAEALVRRGAVVMAANHPASANGDPERRSILDVWEQPQDVHRMLDWVTQAGLNPTIDQSRIAVVGFSLGGTSALMLAGARLQFAEVPRFCATHDDGACRAFAKHFSGFDRGFFAGTDADYADSRISAAVAIAPGFTEAMTTASLQRLSAPALVLTGERDQQLPPATRARLLPGLLRPPSRYHEVAGAQHFSFLPICRPGAQAVLAETGEEFVCQEAGTRSRVDIHQEALANIIPFLCQQDVLRECQP